MLKTIAVFTVLVFTILSLSFFATAQSKNDVRKKSIDSLLSDFVSNDWLGKVTPAKDELESRGADSIPQIVALFDRDEKVVLTNTADLIYPGAKQFYGHGWIVDYDVDRLSVRAGWLLEELTFQDFGFRENSIGEDQLLNAVINGKRDVPLQEITGKQKEEQIRKQARDLAIEKAGRWWQNAKQPWRRFDTILEGLKGNDAVLQHRIFQWLRNGDTKCEGLTIESFEKLLLPEVKRLSKSENKDIQEEAKLLIESHSKEKWWYRYKLKRDYPDKYNSMELK